MKPTVLFFARSYQSELFPHLTSPSYHSVYATLTIKEKNIVTALGGQVVGCFEEMYDLLPSEGDIGDYLITSFASDRYFNSFTLDRRLAILNKERHFWENIMTDHRPVAVVNELVAIETSEVLYIECQKRNIKYLAWLNHPIDNYFYWMDTPLHSSLSSAHFKHSPSPDLVKAAEDYCLTVEKNYKPFYVRNLSSRFNLVDVLRDIKSIAATLRMRMRYRNREKSYSIFGSDHKYYWWKMELFFDSLFQKKYDDLDKFKSFEILFYPLHYEPEATLFYMAEFYSDQPSTIYNISKCLKLNQVLVVKEHPAQKGMLLMKPYQNLKIITSNVLFIRAEHNSQDLIRKSKAIVTLTGTVGLEALILGKPVIVLGNVFYDSYQYVIKAKSFEELRKIIRSDGYIYPEKKALVDFLANLLRICFKGNPFPHTHLYEPKNIEHLVNAIESEVLAITNA